MLTDTYYINTISISSIINHIINLMYALTVIFYKHLQGAGLIGGETSKK